MRRTAMTLGCALGLLLALAPAAQAGVDYRVRPGDTLSQIAARHGVSTAAMARANALANPDRVVVGTVLVVPGQDAVHVVGPGETLGGIAARLGVRVADLAAANGISDPNVIRAGQRLRVSGATGSTGSATVSSSASSPAATSTGGAVGREEVQRLITEAARALRWRPAVPLGLAMQESGWNNQVVSSAGARGLMQVMPGTGEWVSTYLLKRPIDLSVPADNVAAGMAYLDYLYNRFDGDIEWTLAAYYEGPQRVTDNGGPSSGARRYAANVLALAQRYR